MEPYGLGPFAAIEVVTITKGYAELSSMLGNGAGWVILTTQFIIEGQGRRGTVDYREAPMLYTVLGRQIAQGENRDAARRDAVEYAEAQQAQPDDNPLADVPAYEQRDEPEAEPAPLEKAPGPPNAPVRRAARRSSVAIGSNHP